MLLRVKEEKPRCGLEICNCNWSWLMLIKSGRNPKSLLMICGCSARAQKCKSNKRLRKPFVSLWAAATKDVRTTQCRWTALWPPLPRCEALPRLAPSLPYVVAKLAGQTHTYTHTHTHTHTQTHPSPEVFWQLYKVFGALEVLGTPFNLFSSLMKGARDLRGDNM